MSRGTKHRQIRANDALWVPALAKAQRLGTNLSAVIRRLLQEWLDDPEAKA